MHSPLTEHDIRQIKIPNLYFKFILRPVVVAIKHSDKIAIALSQSFVTGFCKIIYAGMLLKDIFNPAILYTAYNISGAVS